jgi:anti-sigma B factor antagonist
MQLRERPYGDAVVVDLVGPVERESGDTVQLVLALKRLVTKGYKLVLLNVAKLEAVDSVMLGAIAQAHTSAIRSGASLKLVNVSDRLRDLLAITKLDRFIQTVTSEDDELEGRR